MAKGEELIKTSVCYEYDLFNRPGNVASNKVHFHYYSNESDSIIEERAKNKIRNSHDYVIEIKSMSIIKRN